MSLYDVRALIFDTFGTIVDWRAGVAREAAPFLSQHGSSGIDPAQFADAWRRRYGPAMEDMAKRAGLPWDAILGAEVVQAYKPTRESYLRTAGVLSMRPDEIGLVAAHNDDLAASRACGLKTVFIPRPTEHGPGQASDLTAEQDWDVVASGLEDLADQLGL